MLGTCELFGGAEILFAALVIMQGDAKEHSHPTYGAAAQAAVVLLSRTSELNGRSLGPHAVRVYRLRRHPPINL